LKLLLDEVDKQSNPGIGGKAKNLVMLEKMGAIVPSWAVVPQEVLLNQIPADIRKEEINRVFQKLVVPQEIIARLAQQFGDDHQSKTYAVRSSAVDEDGARFSFAGQFETFLHVPFSAIEEKIKAVWLSAVSERVIKYREENNLPVLFGIGVVIQEMVHADVAGVAFGVNPVSCDRDTKIISAVYGLGEGLVSGALDADTFTVTPGGLEERLANKTHAFVRSSTGTGIEKIEIDTARVCLPTLQKAQINEIASFLDKLNSELGTPQDIEFAFCHGTLYLLQTRPVTTLGNKQQGEYILWDNSNIIESYPGTTTPLTFSFISKMYEMVYRQFVGIMGVKEKEIDQRAEVFANTLGLVRGRVYYNLLNWYKMLAMLPGYSINAENMERMMGVKERFELGDDYRMSKGLARIRIVEKVFKMIQMQLNLPRERRRFMAQLNLIMNMYKAINFNALSSPEIIAHYSAFETMLLLKWKAPLINDFFAMIWFGMLKKNATKYCPEEPNIHNDLLCGSEDIISVEPIHRSIELSIMVGGNEESKRLFVDNKPDEIWKSLCRGFFPEIKRAFDEYLILFGDRCVGELKLETISYSQNPALFVKVIKSYVEQGIVKKRAQSNVEADLRIAAESKLYGSLKGNPIRRWWFNYILRLTRDLVSSRENLRYERTKAFGMVRTMFSALGQRWHSEGQLSDPRDIFFLKLEEIKSSANDRVDDKLKTEIRARKEELEKYKKQAPPKERFFTYGNDFSDEYIYSLEKIEDDEKDLHGIGCCPGIVQARVRVVVDPNEVDSLNGDILVTSSTDPGWVTLFPTASAIIVERGSLLSHSAIVSREMGIPCIVSVTGLLRTLKSGDMVLMDGGTGKIKRITNG
jgi:pyruvate,water dikinase